MDFCENNEIVGVLVSRWTRDGSWSPSSGGCICTNLSIHLLFLFGMKMINNEFGLFRLYCISFKVNRDATSRGRVSQFVTQSHIVVLAAAAFLKIA